MQGGNRVFRRLVNLYCHVSLTEWFSDSLRFCPERMYA